MVSIYKTYTNIALLLCLTLLLAQTASAQFTGRTWSAFPDDAKAVCDDDDIDNDDDGLIEICDLEGLNAIRNNLSGSGNQAQGCPSGGCKGYELVRDLDFNDDDSYESTSTNNVKVNWTTGAGWPTIAGNFQGTLEGNGHVISNLFINDGKQVGFINENSGRIQNLGLSKINITFEYGGALTSNNRGIIMNCYVRGEITSISGVNAFVEYNRSGSKISNSYADTQFIGESILIGFFVGVNGEDGVASNNGEISDSYAIADLRNGILYDDSSHSFINSDYEGSLLHNIYYVAYMPRNKVFDPVFIYANSGDISNSYWDSDTWQGEDIAAYNFFGGSITNAKGFTTKRLQQQTTPSTVTTQPYRNWSKKNWNFGNENEYPALKYAAGDDTNNPACGTSQQPACGTLLREQRNNQPVITYPKNNTAILIGKNDANTIKTIPVSVSDDDIADKLTLSLSEQDESQNLVALETIKAVALPNGDADRGINEGLKIRIPEVLTFGMTTLRLIAEDNSGFGNAMSEPVLFKVRVIDNSQPTIAVPDIALLEDTSATLNVVIKDADGDSLKVRLDSSDDTIATATIIAVSDTNYTFKITAGEVVDTKTATITVTADDRKGLVNSIAAITFIVRVEAKEAPTLDIVTPLGPTIELDAETNVVVSIADANFDANDSVTLMAMSSTSSVVSVTPESISNIVSNTTKTFTLTGKQVGESRISFIATDSKDEQDTVSMLLLVDAEPIGTVTINPNNTNKWILEADTSSVTDANGIAETKYQWFRDGTAISGETNNTYMIPNNNDGRAGGTTYKVEVTFVDNIGQLVTKSDVYTVVNQAPVIVSVMSTKPNYDEGERVSVTTDASDANHDDLIYTWSVVQGAASLNEFNNVSEGATLSFDVPPNWIKDTTNPNAPKTLQLEIEVRDGSEITTQTATVIVTKVNNGEVDIPSISVDLNNANLFTFAEINLRDDPDGENNNPNLNYQWQRCLVNTDCSTKSKWEDIDTPIIDIDNRSLTVPANLSTDGNKFRVKITYTDGQGYRNDNFFSSERVFLKKLTWSTFDGGAKAVCDDNDIDNDNDGLIELCYLEHVNAIRYNVKGSSYKSSEDDATGVTTGCPQVEGTEKCKGYELVRDLDFNDDDSYESTGTKKVEVKANLTMGEGWQRIQNYDALFEGNGHTISNLMINQPSKNGIGLFGSTDDSSRISNIGLLNVSIKGQNSIGGLVGSNRGSIANSYSTGSVMGADNLGGLVGSNRGSIANSYATGSVMGAETSRHVGGLVGSNRGSIANSYATGSVMGNGFIGGLVGWNENGDIANSYATGSVTGSFGVGGLIGVNGDGGNVTNSYWDRQTSKISTSAGGMGVISKSTADLTGPTTATGIYSMWGTTNWDFGNEDEDQYPILKYARGDDTDNPACGESQQPDCGALLLGQRNNQPRIISPEDNAEIRIRESDAGTIKTIRVTVSDDDIDDKLTLLLSAVDENQNLVILETTKTEVITNGSPEREGNENLSIRVPQLVISGMTTLRLVAEDDSDFDNAISEPVLLKVIATGNAPPTITSIPPSIRLLEDTSTTLNIVIKDADGDTITVLPPKSSKNAVATATIEATDNANYTLTITARSASTATITVTADDGKGTPNSEATVSFTVEVVANEKPTVEIVTPPSPTILLDAETNVVISIADANFDLDDSVTLTAVSSTQTVVSVTGDLSDINSNTNRTFTLTGERVGTSRISFTAMDSKPQQSDTVSVLLRVSSSLATGTVPTDPITATIGEALNPQIDTSTFFTYSGRDTLSYAATGLPTGLSIDAGTGRISGTLPNNTAVSTDINGVPVTVTASDGRGGSAEATFTLLINAEPTGEVSIVLNDSNDNAWRLEATPNVTDANGLDNPNYQYQWFRGNTEVGTNSNTYPMENDNTDRAGGTEYKVEVTFEDNIGQSATKSSAIYTINNEAPVINAISQITVNEDIAEPDEPTVTINPTVTDANHDSLTYTWSVTSGDSTPNILRDVTKTDKRLQFNVPPDWIKDTTNDNAMRTLQLEIEVTENRNGGETTTQTASVVVTKVNNGASATSPGIDRDDNTNELTLKTGADNTAIAADPDNGGDEDSIGYQWQWCQSPCSSSWTDIDGRTGSAYTIPSTIGTTSVEDNDRFRLEISYTDGQGYSETIFTNSEAKSATADIRVRAKVFLEGPLQ